MLEAVSSGSKTTYASSEIRIERVVTDLGNMVGMKEALHEADRSTLPDDVSSTIHTVSCQALPQSKQFFVVNAEVQGEQINDAFGSSSEGAQVDISNKQDNTETSQGCENDGFAKSLGGNMLKLPSGSNACSISLSQLVEVMKGLDKDEFRFLFSSREPYIKKLTNSLDLNPPEFFNFLERLKEHLYLTAFARDASELQLSEQFELQMQLYNQFQKLVDEISFSSASHHVVQGQNELLTEELKQCRSELREFSSGREELRQQLHGSKAEIEEYSAKVDDLQNKLKISGGNLTSLASELADCRNLVAALQLENENLNERLSLVTEEKMKLVEDKEYCLRENDEMATDLAKFH